MIGIIDATQPSRSGPSSIQIMSSLTPLSESLPEPADAGDPGNIPIAAARDFSDSVRQSLTLQVVYASMGLPQRYRSNTCYR